MFQPMIGIVVDNQKNTSHSGRYEVAIAYSRRVAQANGIPLLLPHEPDSAGRYAQLCDALVLSGGVDPNTEIFGQSLHDKARPMDPTRQAFELELLGAAMQRPDMPILGVCLGMQLMALHSGGRLNQYLPDTSSTAQMHQDDNRHAITVCVDRTPMIADDLGQAKPFSVVSSHRQAVADPGAMRVVATAPDGVIEAIDDPARRFYIGVQWHPERGDNGPTGTALFDRLVEACTGANSEKRTAGSDEAVNAQSSSDADSVQPTMS